MVVICNKPFAQDLQFKQHFEMFPNIELSNFQKWALKSIVEEQHLLITAHTGSGKTLPAEFAIQYFVSKGKKVIYTSPIKALSNTKLCDLRRKYPHISFGIVTGDVTDNPDADVLIMTTEILPNTIINRKLRDNNEHLPLSFEMDIDNDLAAVVFDEIHYINDPERGGVWEQAILMLPPHVQLIMLSATIDKPEVFASWVEVQKNIQCVQNNIETKRVYLAPTNHRVVPLTHYLWVTAPPSLIKHAKGTKYEHLLPNYIDKPINIKNENGQFLQETYHTISDITKFIASRKISRKHVLNRLIRHLKNENGLPAICFVFSRKNVELAAKEISFSLFEDGCTTPSTIEQECHQILMKKLPNYKEYLVLPEYTEMIELFKKGIGIHHAGIISVFREMTEMLFEERKLKLLFATETLAVGINFSTTSVIYTSIYKYDGANNRILAPHEYTQISGRAGRRGIDKVGKVWLCANLFNLDNATEFKQMLTGKPQSITSKFKFSFNLALNLKATNKEYTEFASSSLISNDIQKEVIYYEKNIECLTNTISNLTADLSNNNKTDFDLVLYYQQQKKALQFSTNKQKKKIVRELRTIENENEFLKQDLENLIFIQDEEEKMKNMVAFKANAENYIDITSQRTMNLLQGTGFLDENYDITELGLVAGQFQEIHPLAISKLMVETDYFKDLSANEIVGLLSCFANINVSDEHRAVVPDTHSDILNTTSRRLVQLLEEFHAIELSYNTDSGSYYHCVFDIQQHILNWCDTHCEQSCMAILQHVSQELNIFSGEFVKCLLKINNICAEIERVAEMFHTVELLNKLRQVPKLTLKFIATTQSLYI